MESNIPNLFKWFKQGKLLFLPAHLAQHPVDVGGVDGDPDEEGHGEVVQARRHEGAEEPEEARYGHYHVSEWVVMF